MNNSIYAAFERFWQHVANKVGSSLSQSQTYTDTKFDSIESGATVVAESTKATQDGKGNVIDTTYETVANAKTKEDTLKSYTDSKVSNVVGNAPESMNTLEKIGVSLNNTISDQNVKNSTFQDLINDNANVISSKADKTHNHAIADVDDLQSSLDSKANLDHGHDNYLPISGGSLTGNLKGQYITGTWLQTTATADKAGDFATIDASGWIYYRTPAETLSDIDAASKVHNHKISDVENLQATLDSKASASHSHTVDTSLSSTSTNPVQNKVVNVALDSKVPTSRTVNGKPLSANVTLNASDVGADASGSANTALANAKTYTDTKINALIGEGASETLDTIGEISAAIEDNQEGIDLLNAAVGKKADKTTVDSHTSNKSNPHGVTKAQVGLGNVDNTSDANKPISTATQAALNQKLNLSGGIMSGNIQFGSTGGIELKGKNWDVTLSDRDGLTVSFDPLEENQVANKRYVDTGLAKKADISHNHTISEVTNLQSSLDSKVNKNTFDAHVSDSVSHITSTERTNWGKGYTHSQAAHAPSNAEKNQNAFSNVKIGTSTDATVVAADSPTDTLTLVAGANITITPDATNDIITITAKDTNTTYSAGSGISLSGTTISNSGVRSVAAGKTNGTISVNTNGASAEVAVAGLGSAAYKETSAFDVSGAANTALTSAKTYTDTEVAKKTSISIITWEEND